MYKMAEEQKAHPNSLSYSSITAKGWRGEKTRKSPKNPFAVADRGPGREEKHKNRTKKPLAPRIGASQPEPRPAEEPSGTVESPRGKGVAVTPRFILTLPSQSWEQREVICSPMQQCSRDGNPSAKRGGSAGPFLPKTRVPGGRCAPKGCSFVYRSAVQAGSPRH